MNKIIVSLFAMACTAIIPVQANSSLATQTAVEPGVWCTDFTASKAHADANNMPMLVFWANPGCSQCTKLEDACTESDFIAWQNEKKILMVFAYGTSTSDSLAAKKFAQKGGAYPFVAVYWPKETATVYERFCGRDGSMPNADKSDSLQKQLMDAVDSFTVGWSPVVKEDSSYKGGEFLVPGSVKARLESVAGVTKSVVVPLVRTNSLDCVATNELRVSGQASRIVVWGKNESEKTVSVDTSDLGVGETLELQLMYTNSLYAVTRIYGVEEPENSSVNPKSFGEAFDFGEWTLDYQAARAKVRSEEGAHLLAMFSGTLWCPYCIGIENSLLTDSRFKNWAKDNKVVLVLFDQGRATTPATAMGQLGPRLVTYVNDPRKTGTNSVSGASYRSRKGITDAQSRQYVSQVAAYTEKWLAPGTTAARLGNPTILLLNEEDETVAARFGGYREGVTYDVEENIARLDQLLTLAGGDESDKYPSTTTLTYSLCSTSQVSLCASESVRCFNVETEAGSVTFSANSSGASSFTLTVMSGTNVLASGSGDVSCIVTPEQSAAGITLKVETTFALGSRVAEASLTSSWEAVHFDNNYQNVALETVIPVTKDSCVVGMVTVTTTKKGKVKAKYICGASSRTSTFSTKWGECDDYGRISASDDYRDKFIVITLDAIGNIDVELTDPDYGTEPLTGSASVAEMDYEDYEGYYTVALPILNSDTNSYASTGCGYILINATTSSARKKGKVSCSIVYPDGKTKKFSGLLTPGTAGFANLLVFARASKNCISVPMRIRNRPMDAPSSRAVIVQSGMQAVWLHEERNFTFDRICGVYGSYYNKSKSLIDASGTESLLSTFDFAGMLPSQRYGEISSIIGDGITIEVQDSRLKEKESSFSLSCSRTKGTVSGTAKILFADGKKVTCKYKGIILPDWYDCGCYEEDELIPLDVTLPFVLGTCTFSDKVERRTVTRGVSFGFSNP